MQNMNEVEGKMSGFVRGKLDSPNNKNAELSASEYTIA